MFSYWLLPGVAGLELDEKSIELLLYCCKVTKETHSPFEIGSPYIFMFALLILSRSFHARLGAEPMNCDTLWFKWIVAMH